MTGGFRAVLLGAAIVTALSCSTGAAALDGMQAPSSPLQTERRPDVIFVPTREVVIDAMLKAAKVTPADVVYDLGCGDGRIVVAAAKLGARAVGIDIDPQRIKEANENAAKHGVTGKATFRQEDLFEADIREATVVTLYLLPSLNVKLRPRLLEQLKPGTRIVSHDFDMGDWAPEETIEVDGKTVYLWTVPKK
ncbi:RNA methyltransferase [Luteitalea sp. TBR-22]|uniref:SAM-dependent methyltransferase n=1 Tax=Luteitalea sp. TBR-22 TaxID=2802971 RepID=UPI001AF5FF01|nr:methyltransferase domain-containing protein [Luteitalea sp. TBR-22]BCS32100.1 RNA methyltransferase [Luteitalea sp. TBR-22]